VAFSLLSIIMGLSARSETATAFNRDILNDRNQVLLYGVALLVTLLATELRLLQRILGLAQLSGRQWLICIAAAFALLLVDEVIKVFMRIRRSRDASTHATAVPARV
jgi:Ca2+-transporting ATPase